mgnify:CR=1 FL=1
MPGDCWTMRACCARAAAYGRASGFIEPAGADPVLAEADAPVVSERLPRPAREPRLAFHEGGHAVLGVALGADVQGARVGGSDSALVFFRTDAPVPARVAMLLAGEIAERWHSRVVWRPGDDEMRWFHQRVREVDLGGCDSCRAMFHIVIEDQGRDEAHVFARWREIEAQTIAVVQRPDVWRSIKRVADALLEHGEINDERIRALVDCEPFTII